MQSAREFCSIEVNGEVYDIDREVIAQLPKDRAAMEEGQPYAQAGLECIRAVVEWLKKKAKESEERHGSSFPFDGMLEQLRDGLDYAAGYAGGCPRFLAEQEQAATIYAQQELDG